MKNQAMLISQQKTELARRAQAWISSEVGQRAVQDVVSKAEKAHAELQKARQVDPASLNQPVTF